MGFPLNQSTVKDGILTCHWHHARFDLMNVERFHSIQMIEAVFRQYSFVATDNDGENNSKTRALLLVAAARYLAAHSPTMRSQGHTYQIAT
jgi:hypothetical protein